MRVCVFIFILFLNLSISLKGQQDTAVRLNYKKRKITLSCASTGFVTGSLIYLNKIWYQSYNTGNFHFFNDNNEWLQMDKFGHSYSTFQFSRLMMDGFEWSGFSKKQTIGIGGTMGFFYMTAIEIMDGFSKGWGFSWGDMLANAAGTTLAISERKFWNSQRIQLKYSFAQSGLANYNSSLLGNNLLTQLIKDYNGQTYWLSVNLSSYMKKETKFPRFLSIAIGHSAYGMIGAKQNSFLIRDETGNVLKLDRQRRYYFSLDIDLTRLRTKSKFLKRFYSIVNILKIPAPTIKFSGTGLKFYYLYF